jgi:hypothetical protein
MKMYRQKHVSHFLKIIDDHCSYCSEQLSNRPFRASRGRRASASTVTMATITKSPNTPNSVSSFSIGPGALP